MEVTYRRWTAADKAFLREHYPTKGRVWCAERLNRTPETVTSQASRQGLRSTRRKPPAAITPQVLRAMVYAHVRGVLTDDIAELFGCHPTTVSRLVSGIADEERARFRATTIAEALEIAEEAENA